MLRSNKAREPEYYLTPDCPTADGKIDVRQFGNAAKELGIKDGFRPLEFLRLAKGLNPETGNKLTARLKENRTQAWDLTVTVPKELSFAIEVMQDKRAKEVLWDSNRYMLSLVEKSVYVRERKGGVYKDRKTNSIAVSSFYHGTTRPLSDGMPDPHGHIHNYFYNITKDNHDPQAPWKALKLPHPMKIREIELKMHKHMAKGLRGIGYDARVKKGQLEIRSFDKDTMELYSRRGKEARAFSERYTNPKSKGNAARKTRQEKTQIPKELTKVDLHRNWISRMTKPQFDKALDTVNKARNTVSRRMYQDRLKSYLTSLQRYARFPRERGQDGFGR